MRNLRGWSGALPAALDRTNELVDALGVIPKHEPVCRGKPTQLGRVEWLYPRHGKLTIKRLCKEFQKVKGMLDRATVIDDLTQASWCMECDVPARF